MIEQFLEVWKSIASRDFIYGLLQLESEIRADERRKFEKHLRNFICNENCGERRCIDKMDECVWVGYIDEFLAEYEKEQKNEYM